MAPCTWRVLRPGARLGGCPLPDAFPRTNGVAPVLAGCDSGPPLACVVALEVAAELERRDLVGSGKPRRVGFPISMRVPMPLGRRI
jgi:hypothetical protein